LFAFDVPIVIAGPAPDDTMTQQVEYRVFGDMKSFFPKLDGWLSNSKS
jgi:hypothetical protein